MKPGTGSRPLNAGRAAQVASSASLKVRFAGDRLELQPNLKTINDRVTRPPERAQHFKKAGKIAVNTLLIDNYDSYTYNLFQLLAEINGVAPTVVRNDELSWRELASKLASGEFHNVVISPGPGTPVLASDAGVCNLLLEEAEKTPVLGVCFGMQALAHVHGGQVVRAPEPVHGRLSKIEHNGHPLFSGIPSGPGSGFDVVRYHSLAVQTDSLPECLQPTAWTCSSHHAVNLLGEPATQDLTLEPAVASTSGRVLMGIAHTSRLHWGVQFHPESVATKYGGLLLQNFREASLQHSQERCLTLPADMLRLKEAQPAQPRQPEHTAEVGLDVRWQVLRGALTRLGGVEAVFWGLYGAENDAADTFWLDSSAQQGQRFSYLGGRGGPLWRRITYKLAAPGPVPLPPGLVTACDASGNYAETRTAFLDFLQQELTRLKSKPAGQLPFDFTGGFVGYLGYELKAECGAHARHVSPHPDAAMFLTDRLVVVDHETDDIYLVATHTQDAAGAESADAWLASIATRLESLQQQPPPSRAALPNTSLTTSDLGPAWAEAISADGLWEARRSRQEYLGDVREALEALRAGDSYELCLTTQLQRRGPVDSRRLYSLLRGSNPSAHAAWLKLGDAGPTVCCSSPERFLRGGPDGSVEARPIKGTTARAADPAEDAARAARLRSCEKSRAENLMIVDLLRNDLGRVCQVGSVHVPKLMEVETYSTVHNLVSTVAGTRRSGCSIVDCIRAAFPGGSMTGAPKLRSMQILDRLENGPRGVYSGSLGFIGLNDTFDLNIIIRTAVVTEDSVTIGAGGAIVLQSEPESEYEEMRLKARALVSAVERATGRDV